MSTPGAKELQQRALAEETRAKKNRKPRNALAPPPKKLIPFAGQDKLVRGGKGSPNQPKVKK